MKRLFSTTTGPAVVDAAAAEEKEEEEDVPKRKILAAAASVPLHCKNGVLYYRALCTLRAPWARVPKPPFLAAWFALDAGTRRALLGKHMVFAEELNEDRWAIHLLKTDDADMLAALPTPVFIQAIDVLTVDAFIECGATRCLRLWAKSRGWPDGDWAMAMTAALNKRRHKSEAVGMVPCTVAAKNGHLSMLRLLHENGCPWDALTCVWAEKHWPCALYVHGCPTTDDLVKSATTECLTAVMNGDLAKLQNVCERGHHRPAWSARFCAEAAAGGYLNCLHYLHEQGCPWDESTCVNATQGGHLRCLKYAHQHGCPFDAEEIGKFAVIWGHLRCLKYAHQHGCPLDKGCNVRATGIKQAACVEYARAHAIGGKSAKQGHDPWWSAKIWKFAAAPPPLPLCPALLRPPT